MRKRLKWIILCLVAVLLFHRFIWIYWPSEGEVTYRVQETGETIREPLTYEEVVAVKKVLWGHIRWPEFLYGYPACGFSEIFSITVDGVCYMPAWDGCGMAAVKDLSGEKECTYMNITQRQKQVLEEIITARGGD